MLASAKKSRLYNFGSCRNAEYDAEARQLLRYLQFFAEPYVMTNKGGPLNSTMSIVLYMYNQGFKFFHLGYASALAYILFGIIFAFTFLQIRLRKSGFDSPG